MRLAARTGYGFPARSGAVAGRTTDACGPETYRSGKAMARSPSLLRRCLPIVAVVLCFAAGGCSVARSGAGPARTDVESGVVRLERIEKPEEAGEWTAGADRVGWESDVYRLQPGDELEVRVRFNSDLSATTPVLPDGSVTVPVVGQVQAAGKTIREFEEEITRGLAEFVVDPEVSAIVRKLAGNYVFVLGEVRVPGAYEIEGPMTVTQALVRAGGPGSVAKLSSVLVIRRTAPDSVTGMRVNVDRILKNYQNASDRVLRAYDIVYVPKTLIGKIDTFIEQFFAKTVSPWIWYVWARNAIEWEKTEFTPVPSTSP